MSKYSCPKGYTDCGRCPFWNGEYCPLGYEQARDTGYECDCDD